MEKNIKFQLKNKHFSAVSQLYFFCVKNKFLGKIRVYIYIDGAWGCSSNST